MVSDDSLRRTYWQLWVVMQQKPLFTNYTLQTTNFSKVRIKDWTFKAKARTKASTLKAKDTTKDCKFVVKDKQGQRQHDWLTMHK